MIDEVIEPPAGDRDVQRVHVREVGGREIAGVVDLAEHDGLPGPPGRPPLPHAAFEGAAMRIEELPGMLATQPVEKRLCEQPRFGRQLLLDRRPDRRERIGPGPVRPRPVRRLPRTGQRTLVAIMTGRLVAHSRSPGRTGQGHS